MLPADFPFGSVVDLTQPLRPDMPAWPGDPLLEYASWAKISDEGFFLRRTSLGEHSGTHLGAPAHLYGNGDSVEQIPAQQLVVPAARIDLRAEAAAYPDALLRWEHVAGWESQHGRLPIGCIVLLCTGWALRWNNPAAYLSRDAAGVMHYPGFDPLAVERLLDEREIGGLGSDTAGIDAGADATFAANRRLLGAGRFHLENLANLEQLPPAGAWLVIGALPLAGGSGAPARVLALIP